MRFSLGLVTLAFVSLSGPALTDARTDSLALYRVTLDAKDRLVEIATTDFSGAAESKTLSDRIGGEVLALLGRAIAYWFNTAKGEVVAALSDAVRGTGKGADTHYAYDEYLSCQKIAFGNYAYHFQLFLIGAEVPDAETDAQPFAKALVDCEFALGVDPKDDSAE